MHQRDRLAPLHPCQAQLDGAFGLRIRRCAEAQLAAVDVDELLWPFRDGDEPQNSWRTEFWGKWITGAITAWQAGENPALEPLIRRAVDGLLALQRPDGAITSRQDADLTADWEVWGRKYVLLGLLAWHEASGEQRALDAAVRLCDHLAGQLEDFAPGLLHVGLYRGLPSTSILEPLCLLHRATGLPRLRRLAETVVAEWSRPEGPDLLAWAEDPGRRPDRQAPTDAARQWDWSNGAKAYEMLSCVEGLCEFFRDNGEARYLDAACHLAEAVATHEIALSGAGGSIECWCGAAHDQQRAYPEFQETCIAVTWAKLCHQLLRLTGAALWADRLEQCVWNALAGAQKPDGSWWIRYAPLEGRRQPKPYTQVAMSLNCCVANGPRALCALPGWAVADGVDGPALVLHLPGRFITTLPDGGVCRLTVSSDLPVGEEVRVRVEPVRPTRFTLRLRVPAWATGAEVALAGEPPRRAAPGWFPVEREWRPGDIVQLRLPLRARLLPVPGAQSLSALAYGPLLLASDRRLGAGGLPVDVSDRALAGLRLTPAPALNADGLAWSGSLATAEGGTLTVCDWASAGNTWDERSDYRVAIVRRPQRFDK